MNKKQFSKKVRQLRLIHVGARTLGMDNETLHDLFKNLTGQESIGKASDEDRQKLIRELDGRKAFHFQKKNTGGAGASRPRRSGGTSTDMISPAQAKYIDDLWAQLGALDPNFLKPYYRAGMCKQLLGEARPWPQTRGEASTLIEALKRRYRQITNKASREEAGGMIPPAPPQR